MRSLIRSCAVWERSGAVHIVRPGVRGALDLPLPDGCTLANAAPGAIALVTCSRVIDGGLSWYLLNTATGARRYLPATAPVAGLKAWAVGAHWLRLAGGSDCYHCGVDVYVDWRTGASVARGELEGSDYDLDAPSLPADSDSGTAYDGSRKLALRYEIDGWRRVLLTDGDGERELRRTRALAGWPSLHGRLAAWTEKRVSGNRLYVEDLRRRQLYSWALPPEGDAQVKTLAVGGQIVVAVIRRTEFLSPVTMFHTALPR